MMTTATSMIGEESTTGHPAVRRWLIGHIAMTLDTNPAAIDPFQNLTEHGFDFSRAAALAAELENWIGLEVSEAALLGNPTIAGMWQCIMKSLVASEKQFTLQHRTGQSDRAVRVG